MRQRFLSIFAALALLTAFALGFGIVAGFFGDRVYLFDTAAQFRGHAALCLAVVALSLFAGRFHLAGVASLAAAALGLAAVLPFVLANPAKVPPGTPLYTLLQMNLRYDAPDRTKAISLIGTLNPDVVTLQETTPEWHAMFEAIRDRYPYQYFCSKIRPDGDTGIISRRPFVDPKSSICDPVGGLSAVRIDFNGIVMTIASEHLRWPWPGRQWQQIDRLAPILRAQKDPLLIAGDLNAAPWTASVRRFAMESGTRITPGIGPSWFTPLLPNALIGLVGLPIDNVLASPSVDVIEAKAGSPSASDHLPVIVTFTSRFAVPQEPQVQAVELSPAQVSASRDPDERQ